MNLKDQSISNGGYILGVSCYYHDASAALIKDGVVVAAAEEERFSRKKHDNSFPIQAIKFCLDQEGISTTDLRYIGFYEKPLLKFERVLSQLLETFPKSFKVFVTMLPAWFNEKLRVIKIIRKKLKYKGDIIFIPHHLAHAASSFLVSPFDSAAVVTIDGVGEWTTTAYGVCQGSEINLQQEIKFPHSLGLLYSTITAYLGFSVNNSEYKIMGLSAYGDQNKNTNEFYKKLKRAIDVKDDGSFRLDMSYFDFHFTDHMPSFKLIDLLGLGIRQPDSEVTQEHKDIAAAVQLIYEEVFFKILNHVFLVTKNDNLVLSGGVIQNSLANGKILRHTPFKKVWISPNVTDGGTSVGVASYIYHTILGYPRNYIMTDAYLGPEFTEAQVKKFLEENKIIYSTFKSKEDLIRTTAELIYNNKVVGWFDGRMEFGPRALGARSILANPLNPTAQELLNTKIKHREKFRPFAPVVAIDDADKYFDLDVEFSVSTDFMSLVYPIKDQWKQKLPAVTHVDGTGRLQTISRDQNEIYYDLIKRFGELSGTPILINTSFNVRGEPIVCTPYDAYRCMMGTEMDCLVMNNFLIKRLDNLQDSWNSEQSAKD